MPTWPHTAVTGGKGSLTSCCMEIKMERKWLTPQSVMKAHAIYNTWIFIKRVLKWAISTELLISVLQPSPLSTQIPCSWSRPRGGLLLLISEPTLPDFPSLYHPQLRFPAKGVCLEIYFPPSSPSISSWWKRPALHLGPHCCSVCCGDKGGCSRLSIRHTTLSLKSVYTSPWLQQPHWINYPPP